MEIRKDAGQFTIYFFWKWRILVTRSKSRFNVSYWDLCIKGGQCSYKRGCCVSMYQYKVREFTLKNLSESAKRPCGDIRQRLPLLHEVQIKIRNYFEQVQNLI